LSSRTYTTFRMKTRHTARIGLKCRHFCVLFSFFVMLCSSLSFSLSCVFSLSLSLFLCLFIKRALYRLLYHALCLPLLSQSTRFSGVRFRSYRCQIKSFLFTVALSMGMHSGSGDHESIVKKCKKDELNFHLKGGSGLGPTTKQSGAFPAEGSHRGRRLAHLSLSHIVSRRSLCCHSHLPL